MDTSSTSCVSVSDGSYSESTFWLRFFAREHFDIGLLNSDTSSTSCVSVSDGSYSESTFCLRFFARVLFDIGGVSLGLHAVAVATVLVSMLPSSTSSMSSISGRSDTNGKSYNAILTNSSL